MFWPNRLQQGFLALACLLFSGMTMANLNPDYDRYFSAAAKAYGVPEVVLRSICELESKGNPWALNVNGVSFQPASREEALALLEHTRQRPWLLSVRYRKQEPQLSFFRSEKDAQRALSEIYSNNHRWYLENPVHTDIRRLDMRSVDIGLMQINHLFHGRHFDSQAEIFDPRTNIFYAAKYLRRLMSRHGTIKKSVAFYHSNTEKYQAIYLSLFWPIYHEYVDLYDKKA